MGYISNSEVEGITSASGPDKITCSRKSHTDGACRRTKSRRKTRRSPAFRPTVSLVNPAIAASLQELLAHEKHSFQPRYLQTRRQASRRRPHLAIPQFETFLLRRLFSEATNVT